MGLSVNSQTVQEWTSIQSETAHNDAMPTVELTAAESEVLELSVEGLDTNQISERRGLSHIDVDAIWVRIMLKCGGFGKEATIDNLIRKRAEQALREANIERARLAEILAEKELKALEIRATVGLLHLALDQIKSTVWLCDTNLAIHSVANEEFPLKNFGVTLEAGKTVCNVFNTTDPNHPAIAAHNLALAGKESEVRLGEPFGTLILRVVPVGSESGQIIGCISILNQVAR